MGSFGCALCANPSAQEKLTQDELDVVELLSSVLSELEEPSSALFCELCQNLLQETNRLHVLLQTVTSQLDSLLGKIKAKYEGRSVRLNVERNNSDRESLPSRMEEVLMWSDLPYDDQQSVKEETEESDSPSTENMFSSDTDVSPPSIGTHEEAVNSQEMIIIAVSSQAAQDEDPIVAIPVGLPGLYAAPAVPSSSKTRTRSGRKSVASKQPRKKRPIKPATAPVMRNGYKLYVCASCEVGHQTAQQKYACCTTHACPYCNKKYTRPYRLQNHISSVHIHFM